MTYYAPGKNIKMENPTPSNGISGGDMPSPIERELIDLRDLVSSLHNVVSQLEARLNHVSVINENVIGHPTRTAYGSSPFCTAINSINGGLSELHHRMNVIIEKLEV